ncbi:hypothetical protein EPA93_25885 [Ktedonosporobacter rubrisoli]|uniref:Uncharacterized protein n=1 Tax=Ktedonosporobacter rubrisoli TaxID=2509675 RepID=A0A4P6JW59_KTERU|nr:hypothetical protein [Ktedonosporobacter rubrisoli]QBD79226.1 hypothetical protein EPA93_25885 [Ktedonosporobacter rubrisoli]
MSQQDPKKAIIENLSKASYLSPGDQKILRQHGLLAQAESIHFLKSLYLPPYGLYAVSYKNDAGQQRGGICLVRQDEQGEWQVRSVVHDNEKRQITQEEMQASQPWVLLSGAVGEKPFWAGGSVIDHGFGVTHVLLRGSNGVLLEDSVEENLVLFLADKQMETPIEALLYNHQQTLISTQTIFRRWEK